MATHPEQAAMLKQAGRDEVMREMEREDAAVSLANNARKLGQEEATARLTQGREAVQEPMRDGTGQGSSPNIVSEQPTAGLMQQDGRNYGSPQAGEMQAAAERVAQSVMNGQLDPNVLAQAVEEGSRSQDPTEQRKAQIAGMALQMVQQEMQRPQPGIPAQQGPAGLS